ncbi:MAG: hypothetical protein ACXWJZ_01260 [Burkholderiaceae bacterium]
MIEFMVLALPRTATTWCANWLTTDTTLCLHDPLFTHKHDEIDNVYTSKKLGISCTAMAFYADFVNKHPARKVILHRDQQEIDASLVAIGLTAMPKHSRGALDKIEGLHVHWQDIFKNPQPIYEYLLQKPFDAERHAQLVEMEIQPNFEGLTVGKETTRKLIEDIKKAME